MPPPIHGAVGHCLLFQPAGKAVHGRRRELRPEDHPLAPVEIHIAAFLLHLGGQHGAVLPVHPGDIGKAVVLVLIREHKLAVNLRDHLIGMGVEHQDGDGPLLRLLLPLGEGEEHPRPGLRKFMPGVGHQPQSHFLHVPDRGAGEQIVELGKAQIPRRPFDCLPGIGSRPVHLCGRADRLAEGQLVFQPPVLLLYPHLGRIAPLHGMVQGP